jgi:hypothetical protein
MEVVKEVRADLAGPPGDEDPHASGRIILTDPARGKVGAREASVTGHSDHRKHRSTRRRATDTMQAMRKLLPLLAVVALMFPVACKDTEKSGSTGAAQQVEYTCRCGKTKTAPANQAPS